MTDNYYAMAYQEKLARKRQALHGAIPIKDILKELFGINLDYPEWGQVSAASRQIAEVLKLSDQTIKKWHEKNPETGEMSYFSRIPEDRKTALWFYYLAILPRSPIETNK